MYQASPQGREGPGKEARYRVPLTLVPYPPGLGGGTEGGGGGGRRGAWVSMQEDPFGTVLKPACLYLSP